MPISIDVTSILVKYLLIEKSGSSEEYPKHKNILKKNQIITRTYFLLTDQLRIAGFILLELFLLEMT